MFFVWLDVFLLINGRLETRHDFDERKEFFLFFIFYFFSRVVFDVLILFSICSGFWFGWIF